MKQQDNQYTSLQQARIKQLESEAEERKRRRDAAYAGLTEAQRRAKVQEEIDLLFGRR
ncbi:MAG: hypothetical protein ABIH46_04790 [Chloroflexota bacterium]